MSESFPIFHYLHCVLETITDCEGWKDCTVMKLFSAHNRAWHAKLEVCTVLKRERTICLKCLLKCVILAPGFAQIHAASLGGGWASVDQGEVCHDRTVLVFHYELCNWIIHSPGARERERDWTKNTKCTSVALSVLLALQPELQPFLQWRRGGKQRGKQTNKHLWMYV